MQQQRSPDTHFGYENIEETQKATRVAGVFRSVAGKYDRMNDLMSLGMHRTWKAFAVSLSGVRPGSRVLDVAGGTGDISHALLARMRPRNQPHAAPQGELWLTDINSAMLQLGRDRLLDEGHLIPTVQCDAECLPFPARYFDCVTVAFGLRNMTHKQTALAEMYRVLRPGGRLLILEFSPTPAAALAPLYRAYTHHWLPRLGQWVAGDSASYRYLAESIQMHPQPEMLAEMMRSAGFERVDYHQLSAGVVALHKGFRFV